MKLEKRQYLPQNWRVLLLIIHAILQIKSYFKLQWQLFQWLLYLCPLEGESIFNKSSCSFYYLTQFSRAGRGQLNLIKEQLISFKSKSENIFFWEVLTRIKKDFVAQSIWIYFITVEIQIDILNYFITVVRNQFEFILLQ